VPPMGIVGAAIALVASYLVVLVLMYVFTQRLFPVPYEWGRLALIFGAAGALIAAGDLLLPTEGAIGLLGRAGLWLAFPAVLWGTGFLTSEEREAIGRLMSPGAVAERLGALREQAAAEPEADEEPPGRGPRLTREVYEAEARDEDRGNV